MADSKEKNDRRSTVQLPGDLLDAIRDEQERLRKIEGKKPPILGVIGRAFQFYIDRVLTDQEKAARRSRVVTIDSVPDPAILEVEVGPGLSKDEITYLQAAVLLMRDEQGEGSIQRPVLASILDHWVKKLPT